MISVASSTPILAFLIAAASACTDIGESWQVTGLKDAYGEALVECGDFDITACDQTRRCMVQFIDQGCDPPTHYQSIQFTQEGAPIATDYFLGTTETRTCEFHEIYDPRADGYGIKLVSHQVCSAFDVLPRGTEVCWQPVNGRDDTCISK